jgi:hypothetical protein
MNIRFFLVSCLIFISIIVQAQPAKISGVVTGANGIPIEFVNVQVSGKAIGVSTDGKGKYSLTVNVGDSCALVFSFLGYNSTRRIIPEVTGDMRVDVKMRSADYELPEFEVRGSKVQTNTMEKIDIKQGRLAVDATGGSIESFVITAGTGVSSTNELSTQYSVRGGNYNENIVYVNGIEVYRPILIRSGQQEGLSFINPDLTEKVEFSSGGFEARYGDKMSSVLNVTYKKPEKLEGGVTGSMLGGNAYLGSSSGKFSQITGIRYKRGTTLLNTLDTKGDYNPSVSDLQTYMTYAFTPKLELSFLGNYSENTYDFNPDKRQTNFGTYESVKSFDVYYGGFERDRFQTLFGAGTLKYQISEYADISLQVSSFQSIEQENYDIDGAYWLSNVMEDAKEITGYGSFLEHARNYLKANVSNATLAGSVGFNQNSIRWAFSMQKEKITDRIKEWQLQDSMGYSLPYNEDKLQVHNNLFSRNDIQSNRFSGYLQDTYKYRIEQGIFTLTAGLRGSYWNFNHEFILSPRASLGFIPLKNQNFIFRFATGLYYQAPFYKEFLIVNTDENGNDYITLNNNIKSQRSIHFVLGGDYNFRTDNRPYKFTTELYYKKLDHLIPYTVNNVRIQYLGENISHGYASGVDMKLFGQFVQGTDSWLGLSVMQAKQIINGIKTPLPTEQLYNITLYFTDNFPESFTQYSPHFKKVQFNLRAIWAAGIPFSVPGKNYTAAISTPPYRRIDIGMAYRLLDETTREDKSAFWRNFKKIWIGVDAFNLLDIKNVSSYSWFSDINGNQYAVPDKLTGRQFNLKLIVEF